MAMSRRKFIKKNTCSLAAAALTPVVLSNCGELVNPEKFSQGGPKWVEIETGYTNIDMVSPEDFYKVPKGFKLTWKRIKDAAFYEIRSSENPINESNWEQALLVKTIKNSKDSEISTNFDPIPEVINNKCTGCNECVSKCFWRAITMVGKKAKINSQACTGCGQCYATCRFNAITNNILGKYYYFAIRAFADDNTPYTQIACTNFRYKLIYHNCEDLCGHCGKTCWILDLNFGPSCPEDAIKYYEDTGLVYIDYEKCINCGYCYYKCGTTMSPGFGSVRQRVVSSEEKDIK